MLSYTLNDTTITIFYKNIAFIFYTKDELNRFISHINLLQAAEFPLLFNWPPILVPFRTIEEYQTFMNSLNEIVNTIDKHDVN